MTTFNVNPFSRYDYLGAGNPAIDTNPSVPYACWLNTTTGEEFVCINIIQDQNGWIGSLGSVIGSLDESIITALNPIVWWDFSDHTNMFTDAGVTPVSADGDLIYQVNDKSGNGHHAKQTDSGVRPTFKTDITVGKPAIYTNGTSSRMITDAQVIADDNYTVFGIVKGNGRTNECIFGQHDGNATLGRCFFLATDSITGKEFRHFFNNGTSFELVSTTSVFGTGNTEMLIATADGAGKQAIRVNGGSEEDSVSSEPYTPLNTPGHLFSTGGGGGSEAAAGTWYEGYTMEIIAFPYLSDANRIIVQNWLNVKWGR